jgi:putative transposase
MPDHIHIFVDMRPHQSISELAQKIKVESSIWIKKNKFCSFPFHWQEGFAAFSYSKSQVDDGIRYIQNQEKHHQKESFLDEYRRFLIAFEVDWEEKYIFKELE